MRCSLAFADAGAVGRTPRRGRTAVTDELISLRPHRAMADANM